MLNIRKVALCAAMGLAVSGFALAPVAYAGMQKTVEVGGAPMFPSKNIVENAVNSKDHTTLVAAVKAAGLVDTLVSPGPFTVFAPVNKAFDKLPAGTVETLLKPENKDKLAGILTYHVVPGRYSAEDLMRDVKTLEDEACKKGADAAVTAKKGNGKAMLKTAKGEDLTITQEGRKLEVVDASGNKSLVTIADVFQKNGVIHVVDTVLLP